MGIRGRSRVWVVVAWLAALTACEDRLAAPGALPRQYQNWPAPAPMPITRYGLLAEDADWTASTQRLVSRTEQILHSGRFAAALESRRGLHVSGKLLGDVEGWVVLAAVRVQRRTAGCCRHTS